MNEELAFLVQAWENILDSREEELPCQNEIPSPDF